MDHNTLIVLIYYTFERDEYHEHINNIIQHVIIYV